MPRILHILPHRGGGAETYIDLLERLGGYEHERFRLSAERRPAGALPSIAARWPGALRRAREADVVHVHGDTSAILSLPLLGLRPSVWTTHGLHLLRRSHGPRRRVVMSTMRAAVRRSRATICTSVAERDELAALVGTSEPLRVVRNGVASPPGADRTTARAELGIPEGAAVALFAGELEPRKEPITAVLAASEARARGADLTLLLAGDGPLRQQVEATAGEGVLVLGFRSDLDRLMAAADLFVLPSSREGISMALLEAMGRGLAPVVAAGPGNPEAVGEAGVVVPPRDVPGLAAALERLAADPGERGRLGAAARERQAQEFGVERFLAETRSVYEDALR